jgi:mannose-6-phosphate isomerase class I
VNSSPLLDPQRPYLVIPKLVEQPTWGGRYIVDAKGWTDRSEFNHKIGQSYELFSGSNLSLLDTTTHPDFTGELTDRDAVQIPTHPNNSIALADLIAQNPEAALGSAVVAERGPNIALLIKFTQALGNSFQTHIKAGLAHPKWKPKPESWYYFEPGLVTLGVKPNVDWAAYEAAVTAIQSGMQQIGEQVASGAITYAAAEVAIKKLLATYDPWQFVNTVQTQKDQLVDLSSGGIHHSWEEDPLRAPLGNVLYELQAEAMDDISTFRSFDKGKLGHDGSLRPIQIKEYFEFIDRSPETNTPAQHMRQPVTAAETTDYRLEHLMASPYYNLDKLTFSRSAVRFTEQTNRYKHLFVKTGHVEVSAGHTLLELSSGHSCFIPAAVETYSIDALTRPTEVLISY